jgi:hypothetical protein
VGLMPLVGHLNRHSPCRRGSPPYNHRVSCDVAVKAPCIIPLTITATPPAHSANIARCLETSATPPNTAPPSITSHYTRSCIQFKNSSIPCIKHRSPYLQAKNQDTDKSPAATKSTQQKDPANKLPRKKQNIKYPMCKPPSKSASPPPQPSASRHQHHPTNVPTQTARP